MKKMTKPKKKIGRPKLKVPTRKVNFRWPVPVAECLEKHRAWIEKNIKWIVKKAKGDKG